MYVGMYAWIWSSQIALSSSYNTKKSTLNHTAVLESIKKVMAKTKTKKKKQKSRMKIMNSKDLLELFNTSSIPLMEI